MEHISYLNSRKIRVTNDLVNKYDDWTTGIGIMINILIMYTFKKDVNESYTKTYIKNYSIFD